MKKLFPFFYLQGILEGLEFLLSNGFRPRRSFYIAFGHDEEVFVLFEFLIGFLSKMFFEIKSWQDLLFGY